ncbi:pro-melanin-concentrating hormone, like [Hypomesus transpacificus]|uniref:pro-melanin-concentrating hormone, like n=1 Tax=Hypomesus transpacificus TaxID=137520 RepID=UPI001F079287|nr:pro-melanin-concentrating hormone, like [Hypomesus transpacificus]
MRPSVLSVLLAVALLSECFPPSGSTPLSKAEDSGLEPDALLADDPSEDLAHLGSTRIIVVGDAGLWRGMRGLDRLPLYRQSVLERREGKDAQDTGVSVYRRDTMRCMVGRVYRPCWEA